MLSRFLIEEKTAHTFFLVTSTRPPKNCQSSKMNLDEKVVGSNLGGGKDFISS